MNDPHHPDPAGATALGDPADARRLALAERLRALSHPVRLTMLETLGTADRCVCGELVRALPLAQSTVSQHLKVLQEAGLVRSRPEGQRSAYCLDRAALMALQADFDALFAALLGPDARRCAPVRPGEES